MSDITKNWIIRKINELHSSFPNLKIRYEQDSLHNNILHKIEVLPFEFYDTSLEYMSMEADIDEEFEFLFPNEEILFISSESLNTIRIVTYQIGYE